MSRDTGLTGDHMGPAPAIADLGEPSAQRGDFVLAATSRRLCPMSMADHTATHRTRVKQAFTG